jgi:hypothetical protein
VDELVRKLTFEERLDKHFLRNKRERDAERVQAHTAGRKRTPRPSSYARERVCERERECVWERANGDEREREMEK